MSYCVNNDETHRYLFMYYRGIGWCPTASCLEPLQGSPRVPTYFVFINKGEGNEPIGALRCVYFYGEKA